MSCSSHRAKRPVSSIGAAEILTAVEAIEEGKIIAQTLSSLYSTTVPLIVAIDSMDLFTSLSTHPNSTEKSNSADFNVFRHERDRRSVARFVWIPNKENIADLGTKPDGPLVKVLQLYMADGCLLLNLFALETCTAERPLGWSQEREFEKHSVKKSHRALHLLLHLQIG